MQFALTCIGKENEFMWSQKSTFYVLKWSTYIFLISCFCAVVNIIMVIQYTEYKKQIDYDTDRLYAYICACAIGKT